ncbi:MAG: oligosaccharide flippase family protein [Geobacteraceae bacterium]|nr:oligosaccharide flippase family protein [Geobacteraceae bacterium]
MFNSRRLISNAAVSVIQTFISGLVLFLLYRYLIKHLGAEHLGLWSVILASTSVARLSDMGLTGSVVKFVARYRALNDDYRAGEVVQTAAISIALVLALLAIAIYPLLGNLLKLSIPAKSMPLALNILPWAVFSLWLGSVGGVFQSGLDGCQRMDLRNILMMIGNILFFVAAIWLVPRYGLVGLAVGQAAQSLLLMVAGWLVLRRYLTALPWLPVHWSKAKFKEMLSYAVNFQINSIAILFFDPITKMLMSRFGGLSSAAYYEMASQLVVKLRALLIAANQAIVPAVAELQETSAEKVCDLYLKSYRLLFFVVIPFYATILIVLPIVSVLWVGYSEHQFLLFGALLAIGYGLSNLMGPSYFLNLGTGDLKWNSTVHVVMAILNVLLGLILGPLLGGLGVALSAMISMVFSSGLVIYITHKKYNIPFRHIIPSEHFWLLICVSCCTALVMWINAINLFNQSIIVSGAINLVLYLLIVGFVMWHHPYKSLMFDKINARRKI